MNLAEFDALSFDCYGTLIDWEAGIATVLGPWAREHGLDLDDETLLTAYGEHEARAEAETPAVLYPEILARSFHALAVELGVPLSEQEAQRLAGSVPNWLAFPDSHCALASLAERYRLIILSNVDRASFTAGSTRRFTASAGWKTGRTRSWRTHQAADT